MAMRPALCLARRAHCAAGPPAPPCPPCPPQPRPPCHHPPKPRAQALRVTCCPPPPRQQPPCPDQSYSCTATCSNATPLPVNSLNSGGPGAPCGAVRGLVAERLARAEAARRADYEKEVAQPTQPVPPASDRYSLPKEQACVCATDGHNYVVVGSLDNNKPHKVCGPNREPPPPECVEILPNDSCRLRNPGFLDPCAHRPRILLQVDRSQSVSVQKDTSQDSQQNISSPSSSSKPFSPSSSNLNKTRQPGPSAPFPPALICCCPPIPPTSGASSATPPFHALLPVSSSFAANNKSCPPPAPNPNPCSTPCCEPLPHCSSLAPSSNPCPPPRCVPLTPCPAPTPDFKPCPPGGEQGILCSPLPPCPSPVSCSNPCPTPISESNPCPPPCCEPLQPGPLPTPCRSPCPPPCCVPLPPCPAPVSYPNPCPPPCCVPFPPCPSPAPCPNPHPPPSCVPIPPCPPPSPKRFTPCAIATRFIKSFNSSPPPCCWSSQKSCPPIKRCSPPVSPALTCTPDACPTQPSQICCTPSCLPNNSSSPSSGGLASRLMKTLSLSNFSDGTKIDPGYQKKINSTKTGCSQSGEARQTGDFTACTPIKPLASPAPRCQKPSLVEQLQRRSPASPPCVPRSRMLHTKAGPGSEEATSTLNSDKKLKKMLQTRSELQAAGVGRANGVTECKAPETVPLPPTTDQQLHLPVPPGITALHLRLRLDTDTCTPSSPCLSCPPPCYPYLPMHSPPPPSPSSPPPKPCSECPICHPDKPCPVCPTCPPSKACPPCPPPKPCPPPCGRPSIPPCSCKSPGQPLNQKTWHQSSKSSNCSKSDKPQVHQEKSESWLATFQAKLSQVCGKSPIKNPSNEKSKTTSVTAASPSNHLSSENSTCKISRVLGKDQRKSKSLSPSQTDSKLNRAQKKTSVQPTCQQKVQNNPSNKSQTKELKHSTSQLNKPFYLCDQKISSTSMPTSSIDHKNLKRKNEIPTKPRANNEKNSCISLPTPSTEKQQKNFSCEVPTLSRPNNPNDFTEPLDDSRRPSSQRKSRRSPCALPTSKKTEAPNNPSLQPPVVRPQTSCTTLTSETNKPSLPPKS